MNKRFSILIEDDWEIQGNGLGNVAQLQYLPSLFFMKLARKLGISVTFMVDVAQQLVYLKHGEADPDLRIQKNLWSDTVRLMKSYGFDVQLHLHPQWIAAQRNGDYFKLGENWNIGRYPAEAQANLLERSVRYLETLLRPIDPQYEVIAFKGGSWGLQPSEDLLTTLRRLGVRLVMGVRAGMYLPGNGVDYRQLDESTMPYQPDLKDICQRSSTETGIYVIPLPKVIPGVTGMTYLALDLLRRKLSRCDSVEKYYERDIPYEVVNLSPVAGQSGPRFPYLNYQTHLKIGNQPFQYLKHSFDQVVTRLLRAEVPQAPIVIECHTKQFAGYYDDIERFLNYILDHYSDLVEFNTMSQYWSTLREPRSDRRPSTSKPNMANAYD